MSIIKLITTQKLSNLIIRTRDFASASASAPPPTNNPPVWDTQPNPQFVDGFASNYSIGNLVSDPDGDTVTFDAPIIQVPGFLPDGITWNSASAQFDYDGTTRASAAYASATLYMRANDGIDSTNSNTFKMEIQELGAAAAWPPYGAHAVGGYNVSSYPTNYQVDPYRTWNAKKDIIIAQHRYPTVAQVSAEVVDTNWMRNQNANIKMQYYTFKSVIEQNNPNTAKSLGYEVCNDNSALDDWRGYNPSNQPILWSGDVVGRIVANTNYDDANMPTGSSHANFCIGWWEKQKAKYSDQWPWDGYFWDSTDYKDVKPGYVLESDPAVSTDHDYRAHFDVGNADPALFRAGLIYDASIMRSVGPSTLFAASNGGRDGTAVDEPIAQNEWAGFWDIRLSENAQTKMGLWTDNNTFEVIYANPDARLDILFRAMCISQQMVDFTASNRLGTGFVIMDYVMGYTGTIPTTIAEISQAHFEAARLICGLCCLQDQWLTGLVLTRGIYPFPYPDEFVYDPGDPVGGTPSFASIDETDTAFPLTIRAPDQAAAAGNYGVFWQEFDNVLWVVNLNEPTGNNTAWPQATEDTITLPSPGSGNVWRFADSNYVNSSRTTGATACENHSPTINNGNLTGATISMKRWTARMLVRANS